MSLDQAIDRADLLLNILSSTVLIWWLLPHGNIPLPVTTKTTNHKMDNGSPISNGHHADHAQEDQDGGIVSTLVKTFKNNCSLKAVRSSLLFKYWDLMLINFLAGDTFWEMCMILLLCYVERLGQDTNMYKNNRYMNIHKALKHSVVVLHMKFFFKAFKISKQQL